MVTVVNVVGIPILECGVPAPAIAEPFDIRDHIPSGLGLGGVNRPVHAFVLSAEKNDSAIAFSQHTPVRPIEERMPSPVTRARKLAEV